jgi:hypothetical protein
MVAVCMDWILSRALPWVNCGDAPEARCPILNFRGFCRKMARFLNLGFEWKENSSW